MIAPPNVLRYLDTTLNCKNGQQRGERIYVGISHRDFDSSPFSQQVRDDVFGIELISQQEKERNTTYRPLQFLKNIPVEHCPNAYACLLGLNTISAPDHSQKLFTLCYSGDTRPSSTLVRACGDFTKACKQNVSLLLHEATFDDDEKGKEEAIRKRHSTVKEAMGIARKIDSDAVLLTHFSQRYPKFPPGYQAEGDGDGDVMNSTASNVLEMASAYDGMMIPLKGGLRDMLPVLGSQGTTIISTTTSNT